MASCCYDLNKYAKIQLLNSYCVQTIHVVIFKLDIYY